MDRQALNAGLDAIREYVMREVAAGFTPIEDIPDAAMDYVSEEHDLTEHRSEVQRLVQQALDAHRDKQATWPAVTDVDRLDRAFEDLQSAGIVCRQNFTCCTNCGSSEIWDEIEQVRDEGVPVRGYAFFHMQDTDRAAEGGGLYLAYGAAAQGADAVAIGHEIVASLRKHGLAPEWDGTVATRISVPMDWKKRR